MESLSRPRHRRKLSNANGFSGKHAYDGVFSGHRPSGAPSVNVEEYREIFSTSGSSIPVLDLSSFEESADDLNLEVRSTVPDYGRIFGGFRDHDIAISYEELVARDEARAPTTSQSSQDPGDLSHQSSDALKQFNMSYHKISQRNKDGLDGTTHVTQLHAVPGFTCFIDESTSQLNKETMKQKSSSTNNINVNSSKRDFPEKQTATNNVHVNSSKRDFPEKQTATNNVHVNSSRRDFPEKQTATNNVHVNSSKRDFPEKQTATNNVNVNSSKRDFPEKQTSQSSVEFSKYQEESLSDNRVFKTFEADKSHPSKILSSESKKQKPPATNNVPSAPSAASQPKKETEKQKPPATNNIPSAPTTASQPKPPATNNLPLSPPAASEPKKETEKQKPPATNNIPLSPPAASQPKKETEKQQPSATNNISSSPPVSSQIKKETKKQKSSVTNNVHPSEKVDIPEKQTSQTAVESQSRHGQDEAFSDDRNVKKFQADFKSYPPKVSLSCATNLDDHKDHQKRSTATNEEFPPTCFEEEPPINAAAAALRKAIEKAQESIRIAKESVGRKKEGLRGFSSKSFKESLKAKVRVTNVNAGEEQKEKDDKIKEMDYKTGSTGLFPDFVDGEKVIGAKKVINEIPGKISERSSFILKNNKMVSNSNQVVGETEAESIENNACENPHKDDERPNDGFLVLESCEKKQGDTVYNNLTVCQKVETKKEMSQTSDQNGYEKEFSEESFGLLENNTQGNFEQEHEEKVASAEGQDEDEVEREVKKDGGTESHSEEEKFYDVCEVDMIKKAQTFAYIIETNDPPQEEVYEFKNAEETYVNSSSDYDDAEENENVIDASDVVHDTETACKVDQNDNNVDTSQNTDDVSSSHQFQVEYRKPVEKENFENISSDEIEDNKDECEAKSDNMENCGVADVDFGQNNVQFESSSDTIHGMEIEVKEYKEREETSKKEENNIQQSHEETDAGKPQESKDASRESEPSKVAHDKEERERERIKLAVERAIREARERAFAEVRQRVIADTQEKVIKASIDKTSAQSKLRAERALVERATAEARQRALEKVMKTSQPRTQVNETNQTSSTSQTNTESALRSKAKLEKHNRIMERAAKALAEKEKRDLLALREQVERNRLAEHLDADIKRWSTGKEGNLRALLSTLQYILGADSGWKPVTLTEIITTTAVKKAYRKATLCVHPDKLQQRGASIQQKYICEKVFDLLKAAWNRFNSEER